MEDTLLIFLFVVAVVVWWVQGPEGKEHWLYGAILGLTGLQVVLLGWTSEYGEDFPPHPFGWVIVALGLIMAFWGEHAARQDRARATRGVSTATVSPPRSRRPRHVARSRRRK